jgi:hypothetical protein
LTNEKFSSSFQPQSRPAPICGVRSPFASILQADQRAASG